VSIALAVSKQGDMVGDPDIVFAGVPKRGRDNVDMGDIVDDAVFKTFDALSRPRRRDFDSVANAVERAVRGAVYTSWGKKPLVHVLVVGA
jgi:ribonuclease J